MKKLSGEFLSRLLLILQNANQNELAEEELISMFRSAVQTGNLYSNIEYNLKQEKGDDAHRRLGLLDTLSLDKLNLMLPWTSYSEFAKEKILGTPWSVNKRNSAQPFPDKLVEQFNKKVPLQNLSVLEVGCYEGHHTISLAKHASEVWAIDGRIENVIKTLVRVWGAGFEQNVTVNFLNLECNSLKEQMKALGREKSFDVVHHRGVLYHLSDPIKHIFDCASICKKQLYLNTQIAYNENAKESYTENGQTYQIFKYKEPKVAFSPFSGITNYAMWLTRESLLALLKNAGFSSIEIVSEIEERNGPRIELIASKF